MLSLPLDLFGLQPIWDSYVYPLLTNPLISLAAVLVLVAVNYYQFQAFQAAQRNWERAVDTIGKYIHNTEAILAHHYKLTPQSSMKVEELQAEKDRLAS